MNHRHLEGGNLFGSCFCLADVRREVVVDIQLVEHLLVDSVDTPDTLNHAGGIVGNIIIDNRPGPMKIVPLGYGVRRNQNLIIVPLVLRFQSGVKVGADCLFVGRRGLLGGVFENAKIVIL